MEIGTELHEDHEFEQARSEGLIIEVRQGNMRQFKPGKISGFSVYHVAVDQKQFLRTANHFFVVGKQ